MGERHLPVFFGTLDMMFVCGVGMREPLERMAKNGGERKVPARSSIPRGNGARG